MLNSLVLDCETVALSPDALITEICLIAFSRETFAAVDALVLKLAWEPQRQMGRIVDPETVEFHQVRGTLPADEEGLAPAEAADAIDAFVMKHQPVNVWIQGMDFDRPLLENFYGQLGRALPWRYSRSRDSRTLWNVAFPDTKQPLHPHRALEDCLATLSEIDQALTALGRRHAV